MVADHGLQAALPRLLPLAIAWAERTAPLGLENGEALNVAGVAIARATGVVRPEMIRVAIVDELPCPEQALLRGACDALQLLGTSTAGITLGYAIFVRRGSETARLLSHEFRHVFQYEQAGSIAAFLPAYLAELLEFGYDRSPLELDARAHEVDALEGLTVVKQAMPATLQLLRGDVLLGTIEVKPGDSDPPWHSGAFQPSTAFEEVRDLFDQELQLLRANTDDDSSQWDDWEALHEEIHDPGLRLQAADNSYVSEEILIHIQGTEAWWRTE